MGDASGGREETTINQGDGVEEDTKPSLENEGGFGGPKFNPPLFRQRYSTVLSVLRENNITRVADFGCAECQFIALLRELAGVERIYGVDIDRMILTHNSFKIEPRATDFLCPRPEELKIKLLCGSIVDHDSRLKDLDAVTMIELIEHLDPGPLDAFPANVFGQMQPRFVIVTTPNSEFNVLFPNFSGFRHYDHRFEWTQKEFKDWCDKVTKEYNYTVEISGIGKPPLESEHLGCCSQMAVFTRTGETTAIKDVPGPGGDSEGITYELVAEATFKGKAKRPREQEILQEAQYCINVLLYQAIEEKLWGVGRSEDAGSDRHGDETVVGSCDPDDTHDGSETPPVCSSQKENEDLREPEGHQTDTDNPSQCSGTCDGDLESEDKVPILFSQLMQFPKLASLCEGIEELRSVLTGAGYQMTQDGRQVLCEKFQESSDEDSGESEGQEFDNGYPGDYEEVAPDNWDTDEEEKGFVASSGELRRVRYSPFICQVCGQLMDRVNLGNKWLPDASRMLCTYCYGNHCLDCHRLKFSDTLTYEEQYAEWTPYLMSYHSGAIRGRLGMGDREVWDGSAPWSNHRFHLTQNAKTASEESRDLTSLLKCTNEIDEEFVH